MIRCPNAPSLVVLDKHTGRLVGRDNEHIGPDIFHCQWSSPSLGIVKGRKLIFFGGDNGVCYAFNALDSIPPAGQLANLQRVWRFDCDPAAPKQDVHKYVGNRKESPSVIFGMPVFHDDRIYLTCGGDLWWGKRKGWLKCIDATQTGDVTQSAEIWSYAMPRETCSTPAIYDGVVFAADCGGNVHCMDAQTGKPYWTYKADGACWASPMVADGKIYIGTRAGEFDVLAASRQKRVISSFQIHEPVSATATVADGVLYVATMNHLYAVRKGATAPH